MRKIHNSSKTVWSVALSACADGRSRSKGFSTITHAPQAQPGWLRQDRLIEVAMPFDTPAGTDTKPFEGPLRLGGTDDGHL